MGRVTRSKIDLVFFFSSISKNIGIFPRRSALLNIMCRREELTFSQGHFLGISPQSKSSSLPHHQLTRCGNSDFQVLYWEV